MIKTSRFDWNYKISYERGLRNKQMIKIAVQKDVITAQQYEEITGEEYTKGE